MAKATSPGITSWLFYVTAAIITAMVASSFGGYASSVLTDNDPTWAKAFSVAIVLVMAALNVVGSTAVAKVQSIIVKIVLTILTLFAVVTLLNLDPTFLTPSGYLDFRAFRVAGWLGVGGRWSRGR
ncbi:MAG TPA: amino acid permease [Motilibacterales bacterium]|nr:amino acid permease [Motilibacterales bacterium]